VTINKNSIQRYVLVGVSAGHKLTHSLKLYTRNLKLPYHKEKKKMRQTNCAKIKKSLEDISIYLTIGNGTE